MTRPNTPRNLEPVVADNLPKKLSRAEMMANLARVLREERKRPQSTAPGAMTSAYGQGDRLRQDSDSGLREISSGTSRDAQGAIDDLDEFNIRITAKVPEAPSPVSPIAGKVVDAVKAVVEIVPINVGTFATDQTPFEDEGRDAIAPITPTEGAAELVSPDEVEPAPITLRYPGVPSSEPDVVLGKEPEAPAAVDANLLDEAVMRVSGEVKEEPVVMGGERIEAPVAAVYVPPVAPDIDEESFYREPDVKKIKEVLRNLGAQERVDRENVEFKREHTFRIGMLAQPVVGIFNKVKSFFRSKSENYALNMEARIKSDLAKLDKDYAKDIADVRDKYTAIGNYISAEFGKTIVFDATEENIKTFVDKCKYDASSSEYLKVNLLMEEQEKKVTDKYEMEKAALNKVLAEKNTVSIEDEVKEVKTPWYSEFAKDLKSVFSKTPVVTDSAEANKIPWYSEFASDVKNAFSRKPVFTEISSEKSSREEVTVLTNITKLKREERAKKTKLAAAAVATLGLLAGGVAGVVNYFSKSKLDVSNEPVSSEVATNKKPIWERAPASNANAVVETEVKPVAKAYSAPKYLAKTIVKPVQKTIEVSDQLTMADKNIALANAEGKTRAFSDKVEMILGTDFLPSIHQENHLMGLINQIMPQAKSLNTKADLKKLNDTFTAIEADFAQLEKERTALFAPKHIAYAEINSRLAADQMKTIKSLTASRGHKFTINHVVSKNKDSRTVGDISIPYSVDLDQIEAKVNKIMTRVRTPNSRTLTEAQAKAYAADAKYWVDYLKFVDWHVRYGEKAKTISFNKDYSS